MNPTPSYLHHWRIDRLTILDSRKQTIFLVLDYTSPEESLTYVPINEAEEVGYEWTSVIFTYPGYVQ